MEPSSGNSAHDSVVENITKEDKMSHFPLLSLTDELLLEIFRLLTPDDLFSFGFVCQYTRQLSKDRFLGLVCTFSAPTCAQRRRTGTRI
jgi:hypothetical protein